MSSGNMVENTRKWRKTKRGLITTLYNKMKSRNKVDFNLDYLHKFSECTKFNRLFTEWTKSNYLKKLKPSIDRINKKYGYLTNNIQWLTWEENRFKQNMERRNRSPKVAQILNGETINIYKSQREAIIKTGVGQSNLSNVLNGKQKYAGGFAWSYIYDNPELLQP